jgi:hypothetical protein
MKQQKHPNNNKNSPAKPILMIPKQPKTTKNSQKQPKTAKNANKRAPNNLISIPNY